MKKLLLSFLLFVVLHAPCFSQNTSKYSALINDAAKYIDSLNKSKTPQKYLPIEDKKDTLGKCLAPLNAGQGAIQMRIWLGHSKAIRKQIVTISFNGKRWHGQIITHSKEYHENPISNVITDKTIIESIKNVTPISGWGNLIEKMQRLKIVTLENCESLAGYDGCEWFDGIGYTFEIATNNKFRSYYYCNPRSFSEQFWQAKNVLEFANLLEKEFKFSYIK